MPRELRPNEYVRTRRASILTGLREKWLRARCADGSIPHVRQGSSWMVKLEDVRAFLDDLGSKQHQEPPTSKADLRNWCRHQLRRLHVQACEITVAVDAETIAVGKPADSVARVSALRSVARLNEAVDALTDRLDRDEDIRDVAVEVKTLVAKVELAGARAMERKAMAKAAMAKAAAKGVTR